MPYKNTAVTVTILVWDVINGVGKTGDSANLTIRGVGDGSEYTPSSPSITEIDSTNLKGLYSVALTASENNYTFNLVGGKSSTTGIVIQPVQWMNEVTADVAKFGGTAGTFSGGLPDVNIKKISGTTQTAVDVGLQLDATISSRTKPADTQARVTLVDTVTLVTTTTTLANAPLDSSGVTTLLSRLSATRAGYLDLLNTYLDAAISGIPAAVWGYVTRTITSGGITVAQVWDYLTFSISTSGSIGKLLKDDIDATISSRSTPAQVQTSVASELDTAGVELSAVPAGTSSLRSKINFIFQYFNFKRTASNTTETLYKADSSTSLGTASISNTGSLFTKDKVT